MKYIYNDYALNWSFNFQDPANEFMYGASFFFIWVYLHIGRGLFYGSYKAPRILLWNVGVIIYILMMATAFIGYVLPWGLNLALNEKIYIFEDSRYFLITSSFYFPFGGPKISTTHRIGPHNKILLSILIGNRYGLSNASFTLCMFFLTGTWDNLLASRSTAKQLKL